MRTNEKTTVLASNEDVNVKVDYYWVAEDNKLINWNDKVHMPVGWIHSNVRIELFEFTESFEGIDETKDFKVLKLYINDEFIGELIGTDTKETKSGEILRCAVAVGYG